MPVRWITASAAMGLTEEQAFPGGASIGRSYMFSALRFNSLEDRNLA